jgi:DMSO/TMAO reductase YedYZ molybdopterin-dependent catalytic subunit
VASRSCRPSRRRARRWQEWTFSIQGAADDAGSWTWDEFTDLPAADCVTAFADGDYTTNMALEDVSDGPAWMAYE